MSTLDLVSLLSSLRPQIENGIRKELSGPLNVGKRFIYDSITPIHLNIVGDSQECNLEFLAGGEVQLHTGMDSDPDVTVKGDLPSLRKAILQKNSSVFEEAERTGKIVVTCHTWKGQQAMQKVRQLLGPST